MCMIGNNIIRQLNPINGWHEKNAMNTTIAIKMKYMINSKTSNHQLICFLLAS